MIVLEITISFNACKHLFWSKASRFWSVFMISTTCWTANGQHPRWVNEVHLIVALNSIARERDTRWRIFFYCTILLMGINSTEGLSLLIGNAAFFEYLTVEHAVIGMIMLHVSVATFSYSLKFVFLFCSLISTSACLG